MTTQQAAELISVLHSIESVLLWMATLLAGLVLVQGFKS